MRVRAIRNKFVDAPSAVAAFGSIQTNTNITVGREYDAHALSVFEGVVFLQIVTDARFISWIPSWFFDVIDAAVPSDWMCCLPGDTLQLVIGPAFVATDEASYNRMAELDSTSVAAFWRRIDGAAQSEK